MKHFGLLLLSICWFAGCARDGQMPAAVPVPSTNLGGQGTDIGGAIDDIPAHVGSAWFVGKKRRVRYCIGSQDVADVPRLRGSIERAFQRWREYVEVKGVFEGVATDRQPAFDLEFRARCDGAEDLRVLFGVTDSQVEKYRERFERPLAFAQRTSFDLKAGWSRGFVWLDDRAPWDRTIRLDMKHNTLDLLLLHEIGHVLGNPHVPGTVMDPDFSSFLSADERKNERLAQIDQGRELAPHRNTIFSAVAWERNRLAAGGALLIGSLSLPAIGLPEFRLERDNEGQWRSIEFGSTAWGIRGVGPSSWEGVFETKNRIISKIAVFKIAIGEMIWFRESICRIFGAWISNEDDLLQITIQEGMGGMNAVSPVLLNLDQPSQNISLELWLNSH